MKVYWLDQAEFIGGAEKFTLDFLHSLDADDFAQFQVSIVGAQDTQYRAQIPQQVPIEDFKFPAVRGNKFAQAIACLRIWKSARKLRQKCRQNGVRNIVANTPRTIFVAAVMKWIGADIRVVSIIHDFTIRPDWILRFVTQHSDVIVANSMSTRKFLRDKINPKNYEKIRLIENGIDLRKWPETPFSKSIENILVIGRIDPRKGQMYALEAADLIAERNPDIKFQIVGSPVSADPDTVEYAKKCQQFATDRQLQNIEWCPHTPDPQSAFAASDLVLVLPTEPETFGRVVIEALALGKMVVSFDEVGPQSILSQLALFLGVEKNIFLVPPGNAMSLAERIGYLADFPEVINEIQPKFRDFVAQNYDLEETKKRLKECLLER